MISTRFWPGLYTKANTESYKESYKDLGYKRKQGVSEGEYFTVLTSRWDSKHSDPASILHKSIAGRQLPWRTVISRADNGPL